MALIGASPASRLSGLERKARCPRFAKRAPPRGTFAPPTHINPMPRLGDWVEPHPHGIYLPAADAWVDPSRPVPRALVTHGHADHARGGHGKVWATPETLAIMEVRYGPQVGRPVA